MSGQQIAPGVAATYQAQRLRLSATVAAAVASAWATNHTNRSATVNQAVQIVTVGQAHMVRLVEAYMATTALATVGVRPPIRLNPADYTIALLRNAAAAAVYGRPFGAYYAFLSNGADTGQAVQAARSSVAKLAATDLQLAQTHAARDWLDQAAATDTGTLRIVGYRRVLTGPGPHCTLCTLASERTYRISDLLPIHEHCTCTVEPLWGTEPVASAGTSVRVEYDPELGPRLMADTWSPVGPRITE